MLISFDPAVPLLRVNHTDRLPNKRDITDTRIHVAALLVVANNW